MIGQLDTHARQWDSTDVHDSFSAQATVGYFGTWLRLLARHWPVLLSLALAAALVRALLTEYVVVEAARWREGLGGNLAFAVVPSVMLVAMILMLRVVRPSLPYVGPREEPERVLRHLASVAVAFVAFYAAAGYLRQDWDYYVYAIMDVQYREADPFAAPEDAPLLPQLLSPDRRELLLAIAAGAFLVRWLLGLLGSARRTWLAIIALYPEVLWIFSAVFAATQYRRPAMEWFERTRVYQAVQSSVDVGDASWFATLFPSVDAAIGVLMIPVTALVTGTAVLVARSRPPAPQRAGLRRFLPDMPVGGQFSALWDALRRVLRAGVVATMLFCLALALLRALPGYLFELERLLIGERDAQAVWLPIQLPLLYVNDAIGLVLVVSLVAAFVDRTARREESLPSAPTQPPVANSMPSAPTQPPVTNSGEITQRLPRQRG